MTAAQTHTQGKWKIQPNENDPFYGLEIVSERDMGRQYLVAPHVNRDADAAVIVAAPEMLEILTDIEHHLSGGNPIREGAYIFAEEKPAIYVIRAIIARAKGTV